MHNHNAVYPVHTIKPIPSIVVPFNIPDGFPRTLGALCDLSRANANPFLEFYGIIPIPAPVEAVHVLHAGHVAHAAADAAAAAANATALRQGLQRLGEHIGLPMGDSWIRDFERGLAQVSSDYVALCVKWHHLYP